MRRLACALAALTLLTAACSPSEPVAATDPPKSTPSASAVESTPEPEPEPTAGATGEPSAAATTPLTGMAADDPALLARPVLAVKVDNAPLARPQIGLQQADVVVEELVEGGVTRLVALYQSTDPGTVGPVRSGREVDALLLPSFTPLVAMSGAHQTVKADFSAADLPAVEEGQVSGWSRFAERPRPHNLFLNGPRLWEAAADRPAPQPAWAFGDAPAGGEAVSAATLRFPRATSTWTWDAEAATWRRDQDGGPHIVLDETAGRAETQVTTDNVVLVRVTVRPGGRTDSSGTPTVDIAAVGEGDATVLRDGQAFTGRWRKPAPDAPYEWLDADGQPLPLKPGRTWIELLPTDSGLELTQ
ncbi:DUF3048 domain-containing protein [soil metagenome]